MKRLFMSMLVVGVTSLCATESPVVKDEEDKTDLFAIPLDVDEQEENAEASNLEKTEQRLEKKRAAEAEKATVVKR